MCEKGNAELVFADERKITDGSDRTVGDSLVAVVTVYAYHAKTDLRGGSLGHMARIDLRIFYNDEDNMLAARMAGDEVNGGTVTVFGGMTKPQAIRAAIRRMDDAVDSVMARASRYTNEASMVGNPTLHDTEVSW